MGDSAGKLGREIVFWAPLPWWRLKILCQRWWIFLVYMLLEMKDYDSGNYLLRGSISRIWLQLLGGPGGEPTVEVVRCGWDKFKRWSWQNLVMDWMWNRKNQVRMSHGYWSEQLGEWWWLWRLLVSCSHCSCSSNMAQPSLAYFPSSVTFASSLAWLDYLEPCCLSQFPFMLYFYL